MINNTTISFEIEKGEETIFCAFALPKNSKITSTEAQKIFEDIITRKGAKLIQCHIADSLEETKESFSKSQIPLASDGKSIQEIVEKILQI